MVKLLLRSALIVMVLALLIPFSAAAASTEANAATVPGQIITVTSPNGGERWAVGSTQNITWSSTGNITQVNILISRNNGASWTTLISHIPNTGKKTWRVAGPASPQARIKVVSVANPRVYDMSDAKFAIIQQVTVTSANGGESWPVGSRQNITWLSEGVTGRVNIMISRNNGVSWSYIITNTPNDGSQSWTVTGPAAAQAKIKIVSVSTPAIFDISNASFAIVQFITVIAPNGGENWQTDSTWNITWSTVGISGKVNIFLSRNNGTVWTPLFLNTLNDGSQSWLVNAPATTQAKIKITSVLSPTISDVSNAAFTIGTDILFEENFDDGLAQGFGNETWNWTVVNKKYTAPFSTLSYSLAGNTSWTDYRLEADLVNGQEAGLLVRCQDVNNYVSFVVRPSGSAYWQTRISGVLSAELNGQVFTALPYKPRIKVEADGNVFRGYINGVLISTFNSSQFSSGKIGLCFKSEPYPLQYWDNVKVKAIP